MAEIILINDQDQEQIVDGVNELVCRSPTGNVSFSGVVDSVTDSIIMHSIAGKYVNNRVQSIGGSTFAYCANLTEVEFDNVIEVGSASFLECTGLKKISFPKATTFGSSCFYNCGSLENLDLPNLSRANENFALNCQKLVSVNLPLCSSIGASAFGRCFGMSRFDFSAVTYIGPSAFGVCGYLTSFVLRTPSVCRLAHSSAFEGTPIQTSTTTGFIYVPDELVDSYKAANNWKTFESKIKPLSELEE